MTPYDLKKKSEWDELLKQCATDLRMTACLADEAGIALQCRAERYPICAAIRENETATSFICSQASAAMTAVVRKSLKPEVDVCDVGLIRVVVPLVRDGKLVGQITACGLGSDEEELDPFVVAKQLGITEEQVLDFAKSTPAGSEEKLQPVIDRLFEQLNRTASSVVEPV